MCNETLFTAEKISHRTRLEPETARSVSRPALNDQEIYILLSRDHFLWILVTENRLRLNIAIMDCDVTIQAVTLKQVMCGSFTVCAVTSLNNRVLTTLLKYHGLLFKVNIHDFSAILQTEASCVALSV